MTGKYNLIVRNKFVKYELEVKRKYTILRGDTAKGKTYLAEILFRKAGTEVICKANIQYIPGDLWRDLFSTVSGRIFILDEDTDGLGSDEFAKAMSESDNYFILITRESMPNIPYSISEIYTLSSVEKFNNLNKKYTETVFSSIYDKVIVEGVPDIVITEDTNFGNKFFKEVFKDSIVYPDSNADVKELWSGGKSTVIKKLDRLKKDGVLKGKKVFVIVDGAAFGSDIGDVYNFVKANNFDVTVFLPESFEYLLLKVLNRFKDELLETWNYADSKVFDSWEQYYTSLIEGMNVLRFQKYKKEEFNPYYLRYSEEVIKMLGKEG